VESPETLLQSSDARTEPAAGRPRRARIVARDNRGDEGDGPALRAGPQGDGPALHAGPREAGPALRAGPREGGGPPVDAEPRAERLDARAPGSGEELLLGRYRLIARLGAGGFGVVWRAHDELLQRDVAVKRIWLGPEGDSERAAREAHATARLSHPAIVALYEACALGEAFYLISELVPGCTLGDLIRSDELDDERTLNIGVALADALAHAHERGVIHRDIKPQNVLVPEGEGGPGPAAKLTDFGGASIAEEDALTRTGDVLGTLAYMAPEQSEGRAVGAQADLYALALVLYEALSGVNPVRGATPAATARMIGTRLDPLARRRRDLPRRLTGALDTALAPDPRARGELADLRDALRDALEEAPADTLPQPAPRERGSAQRLPRRATPFAAAAAEPASEPGLDRMDVPGESPGLPRMLWSALAVAAMVWLCATGRAGVAVILAAALVPLAAIPSERISGHVPAVFLAGLFAPVLGLAGLAAAFPAVAGQARRWSQRFMLGALGYWWLLLAEPVLARRLWLGPPATVPPRALWEGSLAGAVAHVVGPLLSPGAALGALLWGVGAVLLPWIVRGSRATLDVAAAAVWAAALTIAAPALDAGLSAGSHPLPRGAVLGAVVGGLIAVGARALRGPV
jgi:serine/threonine protein kinase